MSASCSSFAFQLLFWGEGAAVGVSMVFWENKFSVFYEPISSIRTNTEIPLPPFQQCANP